MAQYPSSRHNANGYARNREHPADLDLLTHHLVLAVPTGIRQLRVLRIMEAVMSLLRKLTPGEILPDLRQRADSSFVSSCGRRTASGPIPSSAGTPYA